MEYRQGGGINTVRMAPGILPTHITVTNLNGLKLAHSNGVDNLSLLGWDAIVDNRQVNRNDLFVTFADGTVWNADDLRARTLVATANADTLSGTSSIDVIRGGDGNDHLIGSQSPYTFSADLLYGENGNDRLDWGSGAHLSGGPGDDQLTTRNAGGVMDGGAGNDVVTDDYAAAGASALTVYFDRGYGQDSTLSGSTIIFGESIRPADIQVYRSKGPNASNVIADLYLRIRDTGDTIIVRNKLSIATTSTAPRSCRWHDLGSWSGAESH